jgi:ABC-type transport system substrate-binding protein
MPVVHYDAASDTSSYTLHLRDDVAYAPHAAFNGQKRYLTATDLAYAIARMSDRRNGSPILDMMMPLIVGLAQQTNELAGLPKSNEWRDYRQFRPQGVEVIDERTLVIRIKGQYPPFIYWLAMPFFAPIPWEVDAYYAQQGMKEKNQTWAWQPVGSGAYYLAENNPNRRIVLQSNPHFHAEAYPKEAGEHVPKAL